SGYRSASPNDLAEREVEDRSAALHSGGAGEPSGYISNSCPFSSVLKPPLPLVAPPRHTLLGSGSVVVGTPWPWFLTHMKLARRLLRNRYRCVAVAQSVRVRERSDVHPIQAKRAHLRRREPPISYLVHS